MNQNNISQFSSYRYFDIHAHMHDKAYADNSEEEMRRIREKGIVIITIGTDKIESRNASKLSNNYDNVLYTVGYHPHDNLGEEFDKEYYEQFMSDDKCIAIGECGLDYYYLKSDKESGKIDNIDRDIDRQKDNFIKQVSFALKNNKPLMLHGRNSELDTIDNPTGMDAYEDMLEILEKFHKKDHDINKNKANGNVHFFVGNIDIAKRFMDIGFTFSFGGVLTLTREYDEVLKYIPLEYVHAETDSPYVTPKNAEGKRVDKINSSYYIDIIVSKIAEIKGVSQDECEAVLKKNFIRDYL